MRRGGDPLARLAPLAAVAALAAVVLYPSVELVAVAVSAGWAPVVDAFTRTGAATATRNTLWTAAIVTPVAVALGATAALITERTAPPARRALRAGMLLGLLVPSFVSAQSWARAYGPAGLTADVLGVAVPGVIGPAGVVAVLVVHAVPLAYLVVVAGLTARAEPDVVRAARTSGASAWQALRTVTLPLLRPALVAAGALVLVTTVNAFGIPAVLGLPAGFVTLTTLIYRDLAFAADPAAFTRVVVLAVALVVLAVVIVGLGDALGARRQPALRTGAPAGGAAPAGRRRWGLAVVVWCYVVGTAGLPLVALCLTALTRAPGLPPTPAHWTLSHFAAALSGQTLAALRTSLVLAVAAATAVLALSGLLTSLRRRPLGRLLGVGATLSFAVPGSALAVAVLLAYGSWLRDTLALIAIAYVAKLWALGHRAIVGAADGLAPDLVRAARVSGAGRAVTVRTIHVPLLGSAVAAAWLLVFLFGVQELTMSALLYGPGTATLAVVILNAQQLGETGVTSALAVLLTMLVALAAVPLWFAGWVLGPFRPRPRTPS